MEKRQYLYSNLKTQIAVAKEAIDVISVEDSTVKIGNTSISIAEYNRMIKAFFEITKANSIEMSAIIDTNIIPIALINSVLNPNC